MYWSLYSKFIEYSVLSSKYPFGATSSFTKYFPSGNSSIGVVFPFLSIVLVATKSPFE